MFLHRAFAFVRRIEVLRRRLIPLLLLFCFFLASVFAFGQAYEAPVGTLLELRLQQEVNSYSSRAASSIQAILVAPLLVQGKIALPAGTQVRGTVLSTRRVGAGLLRERARLSMDFHTLLLDSGEQIRFKSRLVEVENAREWPDAKGRLVGIRSTRTPGHRAAGFLTSLAAIDPISLAFTTAAFASVLRFSEPEIQLPAGAELIVRLEEPISLPPAVSPKLPTISQNEASRQELARLIRGLPFESTTASTGKAADLTNLVFLGTPEAVDRAFGAAGWVHSDPLSAASRYRTLRSMVENQTYPNAPMTTLLLEGAKPWRMLSKTLNTFYRRHHIRIYPQEQTYQGYAMYSGAATQDIEVGFSMERKGWMHLIDEALDNERSKVLNDLVFTGCVDAVEAVERPWVSNLARNATGQMISTDGDVFVLRFNDCLKPRLSTETVAPSPGAYRPPLPVRVLRQIALTAKNDVLRGNLIWQGVSLARQGHRFYSRGVSSKAALRPQRDSFLEAGATLDNKKQSRGPDLNSFASSLLPRSTPAAKTRETSPKDWSAPLVELGFHFGGVQFQDQSTGVEGLSILRRMPSSGSVDRFSITAGNRIRAGASWGTSVTLNSHRWLSQELGLYFQHGSFRIGLSGLDAASQAALQNIEEQSTGMLSRQFSYTTLFHLRPRESRWRPYFAAGATAQLMHLTDAPFLRARGVFRVGLGNVGMIRAGYNFSHRPPLEGGGIFLPGFQTGAGFSYRFTPRWTLRADYRATLSKRPDFLTKSLVTDSESSPPISRLALQPRGAFVQHRTSLGIAFTF